MARVKSRKPKVDSKAKEKRETMKMEGKESPMMKGMEKKMGMYKCGGKVARKR